MCCPIFVVPSIYSDMLLMRFFNFCVEDDGHDIVSEV